MRFTDAEMASSTSSEDEGKRETDFVYLASCNHGYRASAYKRRLVKIGKGNS